MKPGSWTHALLVTALVLTTMGPALHAAESETADELLQRVASFYAGLEMVTFEAVVTPEMPAGSPMADFEIPPIRYRVSAAAPNLIALRVPSEAMETSFVQDSTRQFTRIPFVRSYVIEERTEPIVEMAQTPGRLMVPGVEWMLGLSHAASVAPFDGVEATVEGVETIDGTECDRVRLDGPTPGQMWISRGRMPWVLRFREDPRPEDEILTQGDGPEFQYRPRLDIRFSDWGHGVDLATAFEIEPPLGFEREDSVAEALLKLGDGDFLELAEEAPASERSAPAPAVTLTPREGEPFALSELRGRVVLLDFWATWCKPCVIDLPMVADVVDAFSPEEVALWAVNRFESVETVDRFMAAEGLDFAVSMDPDNEIARAFKVMAIPHLVVIDREGVVRHVHVGMAPGGKDYLKKEIQTLLER